MDINGSVNAGELEFTIELDTDDVWNEIEDQVNDAAYSVAREAAREEIENADFGIDYGQGAQNLLNDYNPGTGCSLARDFEEAVQGAVGVGDFLAEAIKETVTTLGTSAEISTTEVRTLVREEIRLALTAILSQMTSVV